MSGDSISNKDLLIAMHGMMAEVRHLADAVSTRRAEDVRGIDAKTCISMITAAFSVMLMLVYFVNDRVTEVSVSSNARIERIETLIDKASHAIKQQLERELEG